MILLIGALAASLWVRLGLYGYGLPVGLVTALPVIYLAGRYLIARDLLAVAAVVGSFAVVWAIFEARTWLNAASDPAVEIPGWSPLPLAASVALVVMSLALAAGARSADAHCGPRSGS